MATNGLTSGQKFAAELEREAASTRKMFERLPAEKFNWKPHEKSMPLGYLAVHITEMIEWVKLAVTTRKLDYGAQPYKPFKPTSTAELLQHFDEIVAGAIEALRNTSDETMSQPWTVRNGDRIFFSKPREHVIHTDCFNHFIHHRGQLSVYLRLNDISVPGVYGPSADE